MLKPISSHLFNLIQEVENNISGVSEEEYTEILGWIFSKLGIDKFAYVHLEPTPSNNSKVSIYSNYPSEWVDTYRKNSLYKSDPVMANTAITAIPFFWNEIPAEIDNNPE
ncbi:autoinducer binding domain-containing protein, partial [Pseudomonas corrugata]